MSRLIFTQEMFDYVPGAILKSEKIAWDAQHIFDTWLKENGVVVYSEILNDENDLWAKYDKGFEVSYTHKALLVNIEEIQTAAVECDHWPNVEGDADGWRCMHCNVELNPTGWEPA